MPSAIEVRAFFRTAGGGGFFHESALSMNDLLLETGASKNAQQTAVVETLRPSARIISRWQSLPNRFDALSYSSFFR